MGRTTGTATLRSSPVAPARAFAFARRLRSALACLALGLAVLGGGARADTIAVKFAKLRADEDGYVLNAEFALAINSTLDEALQKGVPLYFELDFELVRPRWYWVDEKTLSFTIQYRVSYNALTRQYRLSTGALAQSFQTLDEALATLTTDEQR